MIKNIMKNIGLKDVNKALEKYKTDAKNMTTEQLGYYVEDLKNGTGNIGKENLEERIKIYGDELAARNGKKETAEEKEPFLIQGMTKDKYIPWRMDAHGETKAQAESAWNHAEEQAKNKEKKPLTSPDLIPSYDDFNPLRD